MESVVNIICLKWGTKYSSEFPNRLYHMVRKNYSGEFNFYCCTEDPTGIRPEIKVIPLPEDIDMETYWWKLWITSNEFPIKGKCIFIDLDTVIQNDLTELINFDCKDLLYVIKAQWRYEKVLHKKMKTSENNSSIIIWDNQKRNDKLFDKFMTDPEYYMLKYAGNDNYMENEFPDDFATLPTEWFYCRVWGYDDTDPNRGKYVCEKYVDMWNIILGLYKMPDRMICLFNGIGPRDGIDDRIYEGYEHYWTD